MSEQYYDLAARVTVSASIRIKASSLEEAIEKATGLPVMNESMANGVEDGEVWVIGEPDGEAMDIHAE
jgi:hypothetical protein